MVSNESYIWYIMNLWLTKINLIYRLRSSSTNYCTFENGIIYLYHCMVDFGVLKMCRQQYKMSSMCVTWVNIEIFNVFQGRYTLSAFINIKIVHELEDVDKNTYQENHFKWIREK